MWCGICQALYVARPGKTLKRLLWNLWLFYTATFSTAHSNLASIILLLVYSILFVWVRFYWFCLLRLIISTLYDSLQQMPNLAYMWCLLSTSLTWLKIKWLNLTHSLGSPNLFYRRQQVTLCRGGGVHSTVWGAGSQTLYPSASFLCIYVVCFDVNFTPHWAFAIVEQV